MVIYGLTCGSDTTAAYSAVSAKIKLKFTPSYLVLGNLYHGQTLELDSRIRH